jgi:hypothetical protein
MREMGGGERPHQDAWVRGRMPGIQVEMRCIVGKGPLTTGVWFFRTRADARSAENNIIYEIIYLVLGRLRHMIIL